MPRIGGNLFEGVQFPIAFGDRFISITQDLVTGAPLVDIYRWDRKRDRLLVELLQGRPLQGAPPVTVVPVAGAGGVRLTVAGDDEGIVGYLSGGDDPSSVVISKDRIALLRGDRTVFEMLSSTIIGAPIGLRLGSGGETSMGAQLPVGFPRRRLISGATIVLTDLVGIPPVIQMVDFEDCRLVGPTLVAALGPLELVDSTLPAGNFIWEFPGREGEMVGVIGLMDCAIRRCTLEGVGLAVPPGSRGEIVRRIASS